MDQRVRNSLPMRANRPRVRGVAIQRRRWLGHAPVTPSAFAAGGFQATAALAAQTPGDWWAVEDSTTLSYAKDRRAVLPPSPLAGEGWGEGPNNATFSVVLHLQADGERRVGRGATFIRPGSLGLGSKRAGGRRRTISNG